VCIRKTTYDAAIGTRDGSKEVHVERLFEDYLKLLETVHREFERALDGLPDEAVNWVPGQGMNSLAVLATHTAGSERYWIGDIAMQEPSGRVRQSEFLVQGMSAREALSRLKNSFLYAQETVPRLDMKELSATRTDPADGRAVSVAWALLHALEHASLHAGHAELTRQLWEARASRSEK
jgi:uncharacterized damage-inducible protein DinB